MSKKRKHQTSKNTMTKPPVTRLNVIEGDCNGPFKIINDFCSPADQKEFDRLFLEWFDSPQTFMWCIESFLIWFKERHPKRLCMLYSDYKKIVKGKVTPATKEEWESEQN